MFELKKILIGEETLNTDSAADHIYLKHDGKTYAFDQELKQHDLADTQPRAVIEFNDFSIFLQTKLLSVFQDEQKLYEIPEYSNIVTFKNDDHLILLTSYQKMALAKLGQDNYGIIWELDFMVYQQIICFDEHHFYFITSRAGTSIQRRKIDTAEISWEIDLNQLDNYSVDDGFFKDGNSIFKANHMLGIYKDILLVGANGLLGIDRNNGKIIRRWAHFNVDDTQHNLMGMYQYDSQHHRVCTKYYSREDRDYYIAQLNLEHDEITVLDIHQELKENHLSVNHLFLIQDHLLFADGSFIVDLPSNSSHPLRNYVLLAIDLEQEKIVWKYTDFDFFKQRGKRGPYRLGNHLLFGLNDITYIFTQTSES